MRAAVVITVLAAAMPADAEDTFEAKASGAQHIRRVDDLVWALTAPCDSGDDTQQRQCRRVRDTRAAELAGATLIVDADKDAFAIGPWSAQKKSAPLTLTSCVDCDGVEVDGKAWYVVGTKPGHPPPWFKGGKLVATMLFDNARPFGDDASAKAFAKAAANARVQLLVKVPAKAKTTIDGKSVLALDVLGYRVVTPCDGNIVLASPRSGPAAADKKQCAASVTATPASAVQPRLDQLTPALITHTMRPVVAAADECFEKYRVAGKAKLKITITGDGTVTGYEQQGDFANTPTGKCIDVAMKHIAFPASKRDKTTITFPIKLQ